MFAASCLLVVAFCVLSVASANVPQPQPKQISEMNVDHGQCLNTSHHLAHPVTHSTTLAQMCSPWTAFSCCSAETASHAHQQINHLAFALDHCGSKSLSEECHREFVRELCYYSCDPFIAPWLVKPDSTFPKERLMLVPMCQKDCNRWWTACADSLTCVRNFRKHFVLEIENSTKVAINKCPTGSECRPIRDIYADASDFCQTVWDNSWKVVSDQQACVKLDFPHNKPNPNQKVAQLYQYAGEKHREIGERPSFIATLAIIICCTIAVLYVAIKFICVIFSKAYYWCC